ncbi:MAG: AAA family ATPase, partial [Armatimonadota bacterium]
QPEDRLPSLIIIDEPELGLHPYVITLLAEALDAASEMSQVLVTTQSVTLLNQFAPEQVVVVERDRGGGTTFERLSAEGLATWLEEDFSVGELWEMNAIGGGP